MTQGSRTTLDPGGGGMCKEKFINEELCNLYGERLKAIPITGREGP
jgi:hypothetical protein